MSEREQLARLRQRISELFSESELRQLCFDLGLDYDDLGGRGKSENVMELVARMKREGHLSDLIARLQELRPEEDWSRLGLPMAVSKAGNKLYNLPFGRNPNFTGRADLLDAIHSAFHNTSTGSAQVPQSAIAITQAIAGLGGVGKTQLALEYCHRYRDDYDMIGWLRADEEPALAADMVQLGREVGLPVDQTTDQAAQVALVRRWLEGSGVHWLLVFDNADTIAPKVLQTYLPRTGQGRVLITSRNPNWRGTAWVLAVNVFAPDEAVAFLLARSAYFSALKPTEVVTTNEEARLLAGALGYLPLALEHAGAYVEAAGCTLAEYRRLLAAQRARLWEKAEAPDAYHATITTTWELSFQQVRTQNPAAIALFNLCCFLAPEEIPLPLLREHRAALPEELAALLADELALNEAIGELRRYSLLARDGDTLAVHRLVQTMARDQMRQERAKIWAEAAVNLMIAALPDNWTHLHEWVDGPQLLPHMMTVNDLASKIAPVKSVADLCTWTGYYLQFRGVYLSARPYYERALAIVEKALGPDHPDTARSLNNLGYLLQAMGNLAEARPYYERALAIREKALGPDHPDTALSLNNLGYLLQAEGDLVDAHDYLERAYKIFAQKLGDGHPNTQVVKENLAAVAARLERGGQGWVGGMARLPAAPHPSC